jgi:hypothetical protein
MVAQCKHAPFAVGVNVAVQWWLGPRSAWLDEGPRVWFEGSQGRSLCWCGYHGRRKSCKKPEPLREQLETVNRGPCGSRQALLPYDQSRETANSLPVGWLARLGPGMQIRAGSCPAKGANRRCRPARTNPSDGTPLGNSGEQGSGQGAERARDANHALSRFVSGSVKPLGLVFQFPKRQQSTTFASGLAKIRWWQSNGFH